MPTAESAPHSPDNCAECRTARRARAWALRDPVDLLRKLQLPGQGFRPCACQFAIELIKSIVPDGEWIGTGGPNGGKLQELFEAGLVEWTASLLAFDGTEHQRVVHQALNMIADLCRIVRDAPPRRYGAAAGQLRGLTSRIVALGLRNLKASESPWLANTEEGKWIPIILVYLLSPPFASIPEAADDGAIRLIVCCALTLEEMVGNTHDWMRDTARAAPTRIWDALAGEAKFADDVATQEGIVDYLVASVRRLAVEAAGTFDREEVWLVRCRFDYIIPLRRSDAAADLVEHDFAGALSDLLLALTTAHQRGGANEGQACEALGDVAALIGKIWTARREPGTDSGALEQLQRAVLPSLELLVTVGQHVCSCETKTPRALNALVDLSGLIKRSPRVRSIVRDRLDILLQPLSRIAIIAEAQCCQHVQTVPNALASALGLTVRRRCANLECDTADGPGKDDPATMLRCCARCEALYVCNTACQKACVPSRWSI